VTNLASRLGDEATAGQVLITQRLHAEVEDDVEAEPIGELTLKGFRTPIPAFNVIAVREPVANASALQGP
jgi:adenylate cyclase